MRRNPGFTPQRHRHCERASGAVSEARFSWPDRTVRRIVRRDHGPDGGTGQRGFSATFSGERHHLETVPGHLAHPFGSGSSMLVAPSKGRRPPLENSDEPFARRLALEKTDSLAGVDVHGASDHGFLYLDRLVPFDRCKCWHQRHRGRRVPLCIPSHRGSRKIGTSFAIKRLADQRGLGFFCSVAILIGVSGLLWAPNHALTWLLFAGVGAGMSMVTCLSLFGLRARDHVQAASLSAMAQCVGYGIGAAGPFTCGWLHDFFGGWEVPLTLLLIAAVLQVIFAVLAGRNRYV